MPRAVASSHQVVMGINDTLQQTLCVVPLSAFQLLLSIRNVSGWTTKESTELPEGLLGQTQTKHLSKKSSIRYGISRPCQHRSLLCQKHAEPLLNPQQTYLCWLQHSRISLSVQQSLEEAEGQDTLSIFPQHMETSPPHTTSCGTRVGL